MGQTAPWLNITCMLCAFGKISDGLHEKTFYSKLNNHQMNQVNPLILSDCYSGGTYMSHHSWLEKCIFDCWTPAEESQSGMLSVLPSSERRMMGRSPQDVPEQRLAAMVTNFPWKERRMPGQFTSKLLDPRWSWHSVFLLSLRWPNKESLKEATSMHHGDVFCS